MNVVKYRLHNEKLAPRRTRMDIPGWAGERQPRANGSREQVWHCVPFSEGAQYGIDRGTYVQPRSFLVGLHVGF